ncbi:hypothetical protein [Litorimonas sp.]|uniref:hypothetical protein n=1 Tax=Litorimonas sp. TaxID=1892381 RepID=UPI003A83E107
MIISPSISQVLRGVIHEMNTNLKEGLADPVKKGQIDTIIGVLGSCAVRVDCQSTFIKEEADAISAMAKEYQAEEKATPHLEDAIEKLSQASDDHTLYQAASETLSAMSDIGDSAGPDLSRKLFGLLEQRLENELKIIGGGFEAAGRG